MENIIEKKESTISVLASSHRMYTNPNSVSLYMDSDGTVTLYGAYPNFDPQETYTTLTYRQEFPSIELFEESFSISSKEDLDSLDSTFLEKQFEKGSIYVACYVELNGTGLTLFFRKEDSELFAYEIENDKKYKVKHNVISAINFVYFTKQIAALHNKSSAH